jgi:Zn-dependent protease
MWWTEQLEVSRVLLLSTIVWVIGSIVLHELAHGFVAIRSGDRTPIETGHMTWNPLVHMGGMSLLMFALAGIAWGSMPVNPRRFRGRYDEAKVAFAGPAMNLTLVLVSALALALWDGLSTEVAPHVRTNVFIFLHQGVVLNVLLGMFNLLPVPPLDGATILSRFSTTYRNLFGGPEASGVVTMVFLLVFFYLSPKLWDVAHHVAFTLHRGLVDVMF